MINRVVLVGRLSRDPELRRTPRGDAVKLCKSQFYKQRGSTTG